MRKIVLVLAVLMLATPVMAGVTVKLTQWLGGPGNDDKAVIRYEMNGGDANLIRAFAFDLNVDCSTCTDTNEVTAVTVVSGDPNYWVYPGSIDINEWTGEIRDVGSPVVADGNYPGTLTLADDDGFTIEMASLYSGAPNAPDACSVLLTLSLDKSCWIDIHENATRGGVVYEDGNSATVTFGPNTLKYLNAFGDIRSKSTGPYLGQKDGLVNIQDFTGLSAAWKCGILPNPACIPGGTLRADLRSKSTGPFLGQPDGKVNIQDFTGLSVNWKKDRRCGDTPF